MAETKNFKFTVGASSYIRDDSGNQHGPMENGSMFEMTIDTNADAARVREILRTELSRVGLTIRDRLMMEKKR